MRSSRGQWGALLALGWLLSSGCQNASTPGGGGEMVYIPPGTFVMGEGGAGAVVRFIEDSLTLVEMDNGEVRAVIKGRSWAVDVGVSGSCPCRC